MGLKVYGLPMSTCTARVLTCLNEKDLQHELVNVDLFAGEHKQPAFLSKNPFGQIPVLEDGDFTLFESRAITSYICEKYKNQGSDLLRQGNLEEAALVKQWLEVESHQYNPAISQIIYQIVIHPVVGKPIDQDVVNTHVAQLSDGPSTAGLIRNLSYRVRAKDGSRGEGVVNVAVKLIGSFPDTGRSELIFGGTGRENSDPVIGIPVSMCSTTSRDRLSFF